MTKIANDLLLMNSGPTGFGEITLPPLHQGSSITPRKINPVICERRDDGLGETEYNSYLAQVTNW